MAFETGIRGMMTGASGLLWRIPTEILSRNETLDLNLKLKRARQAWRQRIFLNKFYLRLGSQRPNRIRKSAITIITTVKKVSSFLISSRFKRASLVAYRFSIDVCAWHYRGRRGMSRWNVSLLYPKNRFVIWHSASNLRSCYSSRCFKIYPKCILVIHMGQWDFSIDFPTLWAKL